MSVSLPVITQQLTIYAGTIILILGLIGGILNLIVFLSLKIFRENSCAFYLTALSFVNITHLIFSLIPYIFIVGYGIDWSSTSMVFCKLRFYFVQLWLLTSFTCMCLATIDQYLATCINPAWHRWNNIKYARGIVVSFIGIWLIHGIPFALYYNVTISSTNPNQTTCTNTNKMFARYNTFGYVFVLMGVLPLLIMVCFGLLAYRNVRNLAYRTVPLVRRELDKQITQMVLIQVIYNIFALAPYTIATTALFISPSFSDVMSFITNIVVLINNLYFAGSFYIYFCVSKRFRQQFYHVFCIIHRNRWRERNTNKNKIAPQLGNTSDNHN